LAAALCAARPTAANAGKARRVIALAIAQIFEREESFATRGGDGKGIAGQSGLLRGRDHLRAETWALLEVCSKSPAIAGFVPTLEQMALAPPNRFRELDPLKLAPDLPILRKLGSLGPYGRADRIAKAILDVVDEGIKVVARRRYTFPEACSAVMPLAASSNAGRASSTLHRLVEHAFSSGRPDDQTHWEERRILITGAASDVAELGFLKREGLPVLAEAIRARRVDGEAMRWAQRLAPAEVLSEAAASVESSPDDRVRTIPSLKEIP
jgi:hypothetical protein